MTKSPWWSLVPKAPRASIFFPPIRGAEDAVEVVRNQDADGAAADGRTVIEKNGGSGRADASAVREPDGTSGTSEVGWDPDPTRRGATGPWCRGR